MGATTVLGLRYPEATDPADVPTDMMELATDVERVLGAASSATPPGSPVTGQYWVFPVGNGVNWVFRYNAASGSAFKWEFVGGPPVSASFLTAQPVSSAGVWTSGTPSLTLARAGEYLFTYSGSANPTGNAQNYVGLYTTTNVASSQAGMPTGAGEQTMGRANILLAVTAGQVVQLGFWTNLAGTPFKDRYISAAPVRVS